MGDLPSEGLHDDVPESLYHQDLRSLSSTGAKTILTQGLRAFQWKREHPEHKAAFDLGSVVHALLLGIGDFEVIDADSWRTKEAKERQAAAREAGATPILRKDYADAEAMRDAAMENKLIAALLSQGRPEVSAWAEDPETSLLMRGRFDYLRADALVDVKTSAKPVDPMEWERTAWNFRYGLQAYWYSRLLELNGEPERPFLWVAISTAAPYEVYVHQASAEMLERGREDAEDVLRQYGDALLAGKWPGLADAEQIHLTGLPRWAR